MKNQEFKSFLFRSAVIAMACDGEIADSEIKTIEGLANDEIFFLGLDYDLEAEAAGGDLFAHTLQAYIQASF